MDSFHTEIQGPVFLRVEPDAKLDMFKNFDLDKLFDLHLDPPSSESPPLCRITQEGKDPIITTDFYLTNVEPREWILPTLPYQQIMKLPPEIPPNPVQPGEIRLHSCMLYTPQAPVLDLRDAFHQLRLCPTEDDPQGESSPNGRRKS